MGKQARKNNRERNREQRALSSFAREWDRSQVKVKPCPYNGGVHRFTGFERNLTRGTEKQICTYCGKAKP